MSDKKDSSDKETSEGQKGGLQGSVYRNRDEDPTPPLLDEGIEVIDSPKER